MERRKTTVENIIKNIVLAPYSVDVIRKENTL